MAKYINARNTTIQNKNIPKKAAKIGALATGEKVESLAKGTAEAKKAKEVGTALKMLGIML